MTLEQQIAAECKRLGFAACGIARAAPSETMPVFREWLDRGHAAGMDYLARQAPRRGDPRALEPAARSVIVVAARYPVNPAPGAGFSTYARGQDYHAVLRERLDSLAGFLKDRAGAQAARAGVDATPLPEREWALRAGVGWRGRQGQVVHPELGACLLLGELLTDLDLAPSERMPNRCGDCRRCAQACPTAAIGDDGLVDARRCLSYLTIEHKGDIPAALRARAGGTLFGCDLCTAACPWNRYGHEHVMPELRGRSMPDADACLRLSREEFAERFRDTAVLRTGLDRLQRNARMALENRRPLPEVS